MAKEKLRVVLDTNIILAAAPEWSKYHIIIDKLIDGEYDAYVSTEILLEYEEKLYDFFGNEITELIMQVFTLLPNVKHQEIYYNWIMITNDADDNKFADCAFTANVHHIITNDKHFNVLKKRSFPRLSVLKIDEFMVILKK